MSLLRRLIDPIRAPSADLQPVDPAKMEEIAQKSRENRKAAVSLIRALRGPDLDQAVERVLRDMGCDDDRP